MPKIQINDANYYYELHGSGEPLVLIAGYGCDHLFWTPILDSLAKKFQVLIFDNRASGQTVDANQALTIRGMADDIIQLCNTLQLSKPHIVGHSMGGAISQTIAAHYPEKINKLILLSTNYYWRTVLVFAFQSLLQMRIDGIDFNVIINAALPWLFGDKFLENAKQVAIFKKNIIENPYAQSLQNQQRQFDLLKNFQGKDALSKITANTLIVSGEQDLLALPSEAKELNAHILDSKLQPLSCGHVMIAEMPQEIAALMLDFLS